MPKKSTPARSSAQRNKPRAQKSFELVRPVSEVQELEVENSTTEDSEARIATTTPSVSELSALPAVPKKKEKSGSVATEEAPIVPVVPEVAVPAEPQAAPKGSASARLAARRQNTQRTQQRSAATLITAEHYSYVRKDLVFIAVLAAIMFIALIVLHFVPGIGS